MATKRKPGAVIGRPKLMSISERRERGRPEIKFLDHPNKYTCALVRATYVGNHISKTRAAAVVAMMESGHEMDVNWIEDPIDRKKAQKIVSACPDGMATVFAGPRESREDGTFINTRADWQRGETFQARGKYLESMIRDAMKSKPSRDWLLNMTAAFDALLCGYTKEAILLSDRAGEFEFARLHFSRSVQAIEFDPRVSS
jgi:hypothetical protein